jgi:hypothetical protein
MPAMPETDAGAADGRPRLEIDRHDAVEISPNREAPTMALEGIGVMV